MTETDLLINLISHSSQQTYMGPRWVAPGLCNYVAGIMLNSLWVMFDLLTFSLNHLHSDFQNHNKQSKINCKWFKIDIKLFKTVMLQK